jgi:hypothetical protein
VRLEREVEAGEEAGVSASDDEDAAVDSGPFSCDA